MRCWREFVSINAGLPSRKHHHLRHQSSCGSHKEKTKEGCETGQVSSEPEAKRSDAEEESDDGEDEGDEEKAQANRLIRKYWLELSTRSASRPSLVPKLETGSKGNAAWASKQLALRPLSFSPQSAKYVQRAGLGRSATPFSTLFVVD